MRKWKRRSTAHRRPSKKSAQGPHKRTRGERKRFKSLNQAHGHPTVGR